MKKLQSVNISRFTALMRAGWLACLLFSSAVSAQSTLPSQSSAEGLSAAVDTAADQSEDAADRSPPAVLISELAASSDVVAIAKVVLTNYEYKRSYPVDGYAVLEILIPYKTEAPLDRIRVRESGLHSGECYFPETYPGEDGARYLVFLSQHPDGDYRGNPLACKLGVLVTDQHRYALRYPLDGNTRLSSEQQNWVEKLTFNDPNAFAGDPEMTIGRKQALAEMIDGEVADQGVKYTNGLPIRYFSQLIGEENIQRPPREGRY